LSSGDHDEAPRISAAVGWNICSCRTVALGARGSEVKEIRIGYQKNGVLVIARQQATLKKISHSKAST